MHFTTIALWLAAAAVWAQEAPPKPAPAPPPKVCAIPLLNAMPPPNARTVRPDPMVIVPPAVPPDRREMIAPAPPCDEHGRPKAAEPKQLPKGARIIHPVSGNAPEREWFCILAPCGGQTATGNRTLR
jgi:hypothetical protein